MPDDPPGKLCPGCKTDKPLSEFGADKRSTDGRRRTCKTCVARRARDNRKARRDAGEPPRPGKKARARQRVVVSLDERRPGGQGPRKGGARDSQQPTRFYWPPVAPGPERDTTWYATFLTKLAVNRNVKEAAEKAGIHRSAAYDAAARDPLFAKAWEYARDESRDRVEGVAWERAVDGWIERVTTVSEQLTKSGEVVTLHEVTERHVYDAALLRMILPGVAPEYRRAPTVAVQVNNIQTSDVRRKLVTTIEGYASQSGQ